MKIVNINKYLKKHELDFLHRGSIYFLLGRHETTPWQKQHWFIKSHAFVEPMGMRPWKGQFCMRIETPVAVTLKSSILYWIFVQNFRYENRQITRSNEKIVILNA
jgi:hypothetical protein